jgi:hypothetical protein
MARYLQVALALLVAAAGAIHRRPLSRQPAAGFVIAALLLVLRDRLRDQHALVAISSGLAVWGLHTLFAGGAST